MTHRDVVDLLPWYANATLSEKERRDVETHLRDCTECARELEQVRTVRTEVRNVADSIPAPPRYLLNRALAEIDNYERQKTRETARQSPWAATRDRLLAIAATLWQPTPALARVVVAAQLALILALGTVLVARRDSPGETASGREAVQAKRARLAIAFAEGATEQVMRQTLVQIGGRIVTGPSPEGLYIVELPLDPGDSARIEQTIQTLRARPHAVRLAVRAM